MARRTPQQASEKWRDRLKASTVEIQRGVEAVTVSPMEQAAANEAKYLNGVQEAVSSGKWRRGLLGVSLAEWKTAMLTKGLQRLGLGADAAQPKVQAFYEELFPFQDRVVANINAMPDVTFEDSVNRVTAYMREMREFRRS